MAGEPARQFDHVSLPEPNHLLVHFKAGEGFNKSICEQPGNLADFETALDATVGHRVRLSFTVADGPARVEQKKPAAAVVSPHQRLMEITKHPLVNRAQELFGASPTEVIDPPDRKD